MRKKLNIYILIAVVIAFSAFISYKTIHKAARIAVADKAETSRNASENKLARPKVDDVPKESNWQTGLSPQQITDELFRREAQQGGPLQVWKNKLQARRQEAETIKDIKVTAELGAFLDKVQQYLYESEPMIDTKEAQISSVLEAKEACVVIAKFYSFTIPAKAALHNGVVYFAPPAIAKLPPSRINPKGGEIKVPHNFSQGWAIKLSERDRIILYKWNFNERPPGDGVLGIETEFE